MRYINLPDPVVRKGGAIKELDASQLLGAEMSRSLPLSLVGWLTWLELDCSIH